MHIISNKRNKRERTRLSFWEKDNPKITWREDGLAAAEKLSAFEGVGWFRGAEDEDDEDDDDAENDDEDEDEDEDDEDEADAVNALNLSHSVGCGFLGSGEWRFTPCYQVYLGLKTLYIAVINRVFYRAVYNLSRKVPLSMRS
jgi:hypothetical protein